MNLKYTNIRIDMDFTIYCKQNKSSHYVNMDYILSKYSPYLLISTIYFALPTKYKK